MEEDSFRRAEGRQEGKRGGPPLYTGLAGALLYHSGLIQQPTHWWYIFYFFSPENRFWYFMQIISRRDKLQEMSKPVFREKYFKMSSAENQSAKR